MRRFHAVVVCSSALLLVLAALTGCGGGVHPDTTFYTTGDLWQYPVDEGASVVSTVPGSVDATTAFQLLSAELMKSPEFNVTTAESRAWNQDAVREMGPDVRLKLTKVAPLVRFASPVKEAQWDDLEPTGDYWVLLQDKDFSAGCLARVNPSTRGWEFWPDQDSNNFGYVRALATARRVSSEFETRILFSTKGITWVVFRFPSGEVKVSPTSLEGCAKWMMHGKPLREGELYPMQSVLEPFRQESSG